jgi:hypothetical protein
LILLISVVDFPKTYDLDFLLSKKNAAPNSKLQPLDAEL